MMTNEFDILKATKVIDMETFYKDLISELDNASDQGDRHTLETMNKVYIGWKYFMHMIAQDIDNLQTPNRLLEEYNVKLLIIPKRQSL